MLKIGSDKVIYKLRDKILLNIVIENSSDEELKGDLYIELKLNDHVKSAILACEDLVIKPGNSYTARFIFPLPEEEGIGKVEVYLESFDKVILKDSLKFGIVKPENREPLYVAFVWHHHQAPNFYPNGIFHSPWAFIHTYSSEFPPIFESGAYHLHVENHKKHLKIKDVDHLSPSLLLQWKKAISEGIRFENEYVAPDSQQVRIIRMVLNNFKKFAENGNVELMGDLFAHTVQGLVIKIFSEHGMRDLIMELLSWELQYGKKLVKEILGYEPIGAWTPEMYWCEELIELYVSNGYRYTVLCDQHFEASSGEKDTIYEPYIIGSGENELVVFFRDRELSDWISFGNNFKDENHAEREARAFVLSLLERYFRKPGGLCIVALDGENWMLGSKTRQYIPIFFDLLWKYVEDNGEVFKTVTLREYLEKHNSKSFKKLKYIPRGSWIGLSDVQWVGDVKNELWNFIVEKAKWVAALSRALPDHVKKEMVEDDQSPLFQAYRALAIAIDSDYFWYGDRELEQRVIKTWAREAEKIAQSVLGKVKLQSVNVADEKVAVVIKNDSDYPLKLWLSIENVNEELVKLYVESKSTRTIVYSVREDAKSVALLTPPITLKKVNLH